MNDKDMKKIIGVLFFLVIFLGIIVFMLNNKLGNLEVKIIKITHELDYTIGIVKKLNQ